MNQRLQAPVHYAVQTSPTRAGSYPGPYTIINFAPTAATVWVADNAGLQINQGTPVYPGTSLTWEKSGDLWMVADAPGTQVIISYDVNDWQPNPAAIAVQILNSGVLIVDNPVDLAPPGTILLSGQSITADIKNYQSLILNVSGRAGNTAVSELEIFYPSTGHLKRISMAANGLGWSGVLPLLGEDLVLTADNGEVNITNAVLSHRQYVNSYQQIFGNAPTFYLVKNSLFIPSGGSGSLPPMRPFFGEIDIAIMASLSIGAAANYATPARFVVNDSNGDSYTQLPFVSSFGPNGTATGNWTCNARIVCQGDQLVFAIANTFVAPTTMTCQFHINPVQSIIG